MRVLLVDHAPVIGGVERMIAELLAALDPHSVTAILVTDPRSPLRDRLPSISARTVPLPRLNRNPLALPASLISAARLARVARATDAHLIQTFTARTHVIGALGGLIARRPVVWRLNDATLPRPAAAAFGQIPRRIVAVSRYLRDHYSSVVNVTDHIPDGIPPPAPMPARAARAQLGLPPDAVVVALIARMVRWKGHAVFLRALARAAEQRPQVHGLIVGGPSPADDQRGLLAGGEAYRREVVWLTDQLGLRGRVTFTGAVESTAPAMAAADIVAHTSILPEPFGRAIVEAMAAGRPVVAARAGAVPEIVLEGETGLLTPPGDAEALSEALRRLIDDPALRERLGSAGRARAEAKYSLAQMARRFTDLWRQVAVR